MRKYILTSHTVGGSTIFGFNDDDVLIYYHNEMELDTRALQWQIAHMPYNLAELKAIAHKAKVPLEEVPMDVSFDAFWVAYGKKINRKRAEPLYNKLSQEEKLLAMVAIKPYLRYCKNNNRAIADPEKYIRSSFFETDWRGL